MHISPRHLNANGEKDKFTLEYGIMFAIVDLETTGGNATRDRITEVAVILHDGEKVVDSYSTLVNPGVSIPYYITDITGIDDSMVADAPFFREVADEIYEMLSGAIFVAHNVGFDYGFLRESFQRLGMPFLPAKMCTVRTSRKVIPGLRSYSLGKLCAHLGIEIKDRHRAMGDAEATAILLELLFERQPELKLGPAKKARDPFAGLPQNLNRDQLKGIPERPGIFFLHSGEDGVFFAARSSNLRKDSFKKMRSLAKAGDAIQDVTWEVTGSELLAVLRLPSAAADCSAVKVNGMLKGKERIGVYAYQDQRNYMRLYTAPRKRGDRAVAGFPSEADAQAALLSRVRQHRLCPSLSGVETGVCGEGKCDGACQGLEAPEEYNARVEQALVGIGFPHPRFFVLGNGRSEDELSVVCVENGSCLGYAYLDAGQPWNNPEVVLGLLEPFAHPKDRALNIRQFLPRLVSEKIVPY
jgi:DNA polymerase-3 subunit epsilon